MSVYREVYEKINASQPQGQVLYPESARILKVQEEAGEVAQAVIGYYGMNARKGVTHDEIGVAKELADVVVAAMVAMHDWVESPERFMKEHLQNLLVRIKGEGS